MDMVISTKKVKKPAATVSLVSRELYFTCMKNRITSTALMQAMAKRDDGVEDAQLQIGRTHRNRGEDQQQSEDDPVDLGADDVLFVVRRFGVEYFLVRQFRHRLPSNPFLLPITGAG